MSLQPLAPSGFGPSASDMRARLAQETASGKTQQEAVTDILNSTDGMTADGVSLDQLFGTTDGSSTDGTLASYLDDTSSSSDDWSSVFDSFTTEARQTLLQAQEKEGGQTGLAADSTTLNATTASATANQQLLQLSDSMASLLLGPPTE